MIPTLFETVVAVLDGLGVHCALIGAGALGVHGVARSTYDIDLLVSSAAVLDAGMWATLQTQGVLVEVRRGDANDPLAGVVRLLAAGERPVDIIVCRTAWQADTIDRGEPVAVGGVRVPVVRAADLVLLKLYAGGHQDAWDITQLLAGDDREALIEEVTSRLECLSADARALWQRLVAQ
jgi:hypothetical protein